MSLEYAERRIAEAIKLAKGNTTRARQQIIAWALEDPKLLQALTKSHLSGIVAYNLERVISGRAAAARKAQKPAQKQTKTKQAPAKEQGDFGVELLKAVASSSSEVFGLENNGDLSRPGQVSQNHINAIRAIASRNKKT